MPRRQQQPNPIEILIQELEDVVVPTNLPVSLSLSKQFFALAKKAKLKLEHCPICLDELCCANCFTLLPCGHYLCAPCYVRLPVKRCPVCRAE